MALGLRMQEPTKELSSTRPNNWQSSKKTARDNKFKFRKSKTSDKWAIGNTPKYLEDASKINQTYKPPDFQMFQTRTCCDRAKRNGNHLMRHFLQQDGAPDYTAAYNFVVNLRTTISTKTTKELNDFIAREFDRCLVDTKDKNQMVWEIDSILLCRLLSFILLLILGVK